MILITGAAGKTGQAIIQALDAQKAAVRAFVRSTEQGQTIAATATIEVAVGDLREKRDLARACNGIQTIYHICPNMQADEFAIAQRLFDVAIAVGVERIVYHSVLHPQTRAMAHHWNKLAVEELLFTTALDYTILQPAAYIQNVLAGWHRITTNGRYLIPYNSKTRLGMVDLHDVAEVAARVLIEGGHRGATYELASDEWLTQDEVAAILSKLLDRAVVTEQQSHDEWQAQRAGLSAYAIDTLLAMFDYYEQYGFGGNGHCLRSLLGREPTTFADCMHRYIKP